MPSPARETLREEHDGLAIDLRPVPLAHGIEIRRALLEWLTGLPAIGLQEVGRGCEHVRHAVTQIDAAVAVKIDAVLDVGRRQKLRLADLARVGADQIAQRQIATLNDSERGNQLAL